MSLKLTRKFVKDRRDRTERFCREAGFDPDKPEELLDHAEALILRLCQDWMTMQDGRLEGGPKIGDSVWRSGIVWRWVVFDERSHYSRRDVIASGWSFFRGNAEVEAARENTRAMAARCTGGRG